jgi:hypothetical protein
VTREEFVDRWRWHLGGIALDAVAARNNDERAFFLRAVFAKIDKNLGAMYDDLQPAPTPKPAEPAKNGQPATTRTPVKG